MNVTLNMTSTLTKLSSAVKLICSHTYSVLQSDVIFFLFYLMISQTFSRKSDSLQCSLIISISASVFDLSHLFIGSFSFICFHHTCRCTTSRETTRMRVKLWCRSSSRTSATASSSPWSSTCLIPSTPNCRGRREPDLTTVSPSHSNCHQVRIF